MKTWYCPDETPLFDHTTQLCTICTIPDCKVCVNVTYCGFCDTDNKFGLNVSTGECGKCSLEDNVFLNSTSKECQECTENTDRECTSLSGIGNKFEWVSCNKFVLTFELEDQAE